MMARSYGPVAIFWSTPCANLRNRVSLRLQPAGRGALTVHGSLPVKWLQIPKCPGNHDSQTVSEAVLTGGRALILTRHPPCSEPLPDHILICMSEQKTGAKRWLKNRRSERIELHVPVVIYRPTGEGPPFCENTQTLVVSAHGAQIPLKALVATKQRLLLQNTNSGEQQECRVVSINNELGGPCKVAVEFTQPSPGFWHLAYPPSDWTKSN